MRGVLLVDWLTLRGTSSTTSVIQSDADYLDLSAYQDFTAWVEIEDFAAGGATAPTLWLETAPLKDEILFTPAGGTQTSVALAVGLTTVTNVLNAPLADQVPLARWLRWRIALTGASSNWSVTFRVHVAVHSVCLPDAS
jgi:hypothetical protein